MITGIFLLDKAQGPTSAQAISAVKRKLGLEKIGHAGTLDPMAGGLLVCLSGGATRVAAYAEEGQKTYSGEILFGRATDTDDITGATLMESAVLPGESEVQELARKFVGAIDQVPPQYSALKVHGQRAYDLARQGQEVELKSRRIEVFGFSLVAVGAGRFSFTLTCSPGTYVRSLARDMGAAFGCGGCLAALRREASWPFSCAAAKVLEDLSLNDMLDWRALFPGVPQLMLADDYARRLAGGDQRVWFEIEKSEHYRLTLDGRARVLFGNAERDILLGIAENTKAGWRIAVNVGA